MSWQERVADKKKRLDATIPDAWRIKDVPSTASVIDFPKGSGLLSEEELAITETSAVDLVQRMAVGVLTSVAVTTAFCKRAAMAQQLLNCTLEFFPEKALARAKELDDYYAANEKVVGPLHGLPISLKDQFRIKGLETTMGYVDWIGKYETHDSILVTLLQKAGAVFYVKTNVPQSLMAAETINNIVGRTVNPYGKEWAPGGSSGGEGAIVAFRGAAVGVGTDIGGSIRIPAAFNHVYGLRPSHGRLPYSKMANSMEGQETIHSVCGPLAHSVADMRLFVTSVLAGKPWAYDSKVIPMPWRQNEEDAIKSKISSSALTLGFYTCDGNVLPHPPVIRAIKEVVDVMQQAGHNVVPWEPYKHPHGVTLVSKIYGADGGADIFQTIQASGEPVVPNILDLVKPDLPKLSMNELWDVHLEKWEYQCEYLAAIRELEEKLGTELDAIVAPVAPTAAVRHDEYRYVGYTSAINLLDFSTVVVPVTFADKTIDAKDEGYTPLNDLDAAVHDDYDAEAYNGAPVAVQIIGRRLTEERIMAVAEEVGRLLARAK